MTNSSADLFEAIFVKPAMSAKRMETSLIKFIVNGRNLRTPKKERDIKLEARKEKQILKMKKFFVKRLKVFAKKVSLRFNTKEKNKNVKQIFF